MRKYRWIALLCVFCLILGGCGGRRAPKQLKEAPFLHAVGTTIVDATGKEIRVRSKQIIFSGQDSDGAMVDAALSDEQYNSLTLRLMSDAVDMQADWTLKKEAVDFIVQTMEKCSVAARYLFIEFGEYPETYNAWYDDSDFNINVISLWSEVSELLKGEAYLGAYIVNNIPRPGASENATALETYEVLLQQICDVIRANDEQQMIAVGMLSPYLSDEDAYHAFPMIKDHNFSYVAPLEDMFFYSRQQASDGEAAAHLTYPNTFWHGVQRINLFDTVFGSEITTASTDYQTRATDVFTVEEDGLFARIGANVDPTESDGGGELRVLSVRFVECDADGKEKKVIYNMDSSVGIPFDYRIRGGFTGEGSVYDDGTAYLESISDTTFFYISNLQIPLEKGKQYQLTVTMKQRGMNSNFACTPAVQMYSCGEYYTLDAAMIENNCNTLLAETESVGVPLIFNDIGVSEAVNENKGREQYISDVIGVVEKLSQSYIIY